MTSKRPTELNGLRAIVSVGQVHGIEMPPDPGDYADRLAYDAAQEAYFRRVHCWRAEFKDDR